jgi:TIR domain
VELFLSYSRDDSAMVDRLRTDLEAAGHGVWLDTDDIRGGERWRTSIAEGIRGADRVILLISSHSMTSENVSRELSVADDLEIPILPVRLETSEIPPEFQLLLAGIQYIDFELQPYESALAELLRVLSGRGSPPSPTLTPEPRRSIRPKRLRTVAVGASVIAVIALIATRGPDDLATTVTSAFATSTAAVTHLVTTTLPAEPRTYELGGFAWLAGVRFSPTEATHNPIDQTVTVEYDVEVTQTETRTWPELYNSLLLELADKHQIPVWSDDGQVPGLSPSTVKFTYLNIPPDTDLSAATLLFGGQTEQRWTLPMTPKGTGEGPEPIQVDIEEGRPRVEAEGLYLEISRVDMVPWSCQRASDGGQEWRGVTAYGPISNDRFSAVITGTLGSNNPWRGGNAPVDISLTQPNDRRSASVGLYNLYLEGDYATQVPFCFAVSTPISGTYTLNWSSALGGADSFVFNVP